MFWRCNRVCLYKKDSRCSHVWYHTAADLASRKIIYRIANVLGHCWNLKLKLILKHCYQSHFSSSATVTGKTIWTVWLITAVLFFVSSEVGFFHNHCSLSYSFKLKRLISIFINKGVMWTIFEYTHLVLWTAVREHKRGWTEFISKPSFIGGT